MALTERPDKSHDIKYAKSKWHQHQKLENLDKVQKQINEPELSSEMLKKWVKNLPHYKPSPSKLNILSTGANFAVSTVEILIKECIAQSELACLVYQRAKPTVSGPIFGVRSHPQNPQSQT